MSVIIPIVWTIVGLACIAQGFVTWRSGGRRPSYLGAIFATPGGAQLLWTSTAAWRDPALAALAVV